MASRPVSLRRPGPGAGWQYQPLGPHRRRRTYGGMGSAANSPPPRPARLLFRRRHPVWPWSRQHRACISATDSHCPRVREPARSHPFIPPFRASGTPRLEPARRCRHSDRGVEKQYAREIAGQSKTFGSRQAGGPPPWFSFRLPSCETPQTDSVSKRVRGTLPRPECAAGLITPASERDGGDDRCGWRY